jgi:CubicO group peptidase (beta-lactamase class C family)
MRTLRYSLVVLCGLCPTGGKGAAPDRPMTGKAVADFKPLDDAVLRFMDTVQAPAATVAVSRNGTLVYSRGYGWCDAAKKTPTEPDTLMRIASVSKPMTAAEIKKLIRAKKLTLDSKVFPLLGIKPYNGKEGDPRLGAITVGQLLKHQGGWDRGKSYDPMFMTGTIAKALQLKGPVTPVNVIQYMLAQPLQFAPGQRSAYSNFGYCVLGRVIEQVTAKPYGDAMAADIFGPGGIRDIKLGRTSSKARDPREVWYPAADQAFSVEVMDAHGGWIASAPALCRFMDAYWISGEPRDKGSQNWTFFGSLPGTSAMARQRPDGFNIAVLLNNRRDNQIDADLSLLARSVNKVFDQISGGRAK